MDEVELIKKCQQGDMESLNSLFRLYGPKALNTAYLISGNKDAADDITQEAFIRCFKYIKKLQSPEAFSSWLYRIICSVCWQLYSKNKKIEIVDIQEECSIYSDEDADPGRIIFKEYLKGTVNDALNKLSIPLRTTVVLFYYNDMSIKEISKVLGCFEGTVKSRLHNAKKLLARELEKEWTDEFFNMAAENRKECLNGGR
ncbi:MAG TPA: RNA polymerase sigma factor [Clostridia bacterium]|nr:RNA polymerase sigma factor [Clostridia bacterium]